MVVHSNMTAKDRGLPCPECGKFVLKSSMMLHMAAAHKAENVPPKIKEMLKLHECDICHRKYRGLSGLEKHKRCVHSKVRVPTICGCVHSII